MYRMPRLLLLAGFFLLLVGLSCQKMRTGGSELSTAAKPDEIVPTGFVPLFNGINLEGWTVKNPENQDW